MKMFDDAWAESWKKKRKGMNGNGMAQNYDLKFLEPKNGLGFTAKMKMQFLEAFKQHTVATAVCKLMEIDRLTMYDALALDPLFREKYNLVLQSPQKNGELAEKWKKPEIQVPNKRWIGSLAARIGKYGA